MKVISHSKRGDSFVRLLSVLLLLFNERKGPFLFENLSSVNGLVFVTMR